MLNSSATSLLDGSASTARPFGSYSFTPQSGTTPGFHHAGSLLSLGFPRFCEPENCWCLTHRYHLFAGNLQGLHNQGNYNMQTMPNTLSSRNAGYGGPSSAAHQSGGGVSSGRFSINNLGVGLSQVIFSHSFLMIWVVSASNSDINMREKLFFLFFKSDLQVPQLSCCPFPLESTVKVREVSEINIYGF